MSFAEADVAEAVIRLWRATPGLATVDLWRGRIQASDRPAMPYAVLRVGKGVTPNGYMAPNADGGPYLDYRVVELDLYVTSAHSDRLAGILDEAFCHWPTLATTGGTFLSCRPLEPVSATVDPATRRGEDVWKLSARIEVLTQRTL